MNFIALMELEDNFCEKTAGIWKLGGYVVIAIRIIVPLLIIIFGVIDLSKAVIASDDKAIRVAIGSLAKRLLLGILIFFVPTIVELLLDLVNGVEDDVDNNALTNSCWYCLVDANGDKCSSVTN